MGSIRALTGRRLMGNIRALREQRLMGNIHPLLQTDDEHRYCQFMPHGIDRLSVNKIL
jgi:hypothetical protein